MVVNSRPQKRSNSVWRRRKCLRCQAVFSTIEQVDYEKTWVVQYQDGRLSAFLRDKLFVSIFKSCQHRPTALTDALGITATVITQAAHKIQHGTISASELALLCHQALSHFDQPAAIHYQAFHTTTLKEI
ncbi:MAG TPA: hypothetical protein VK983_05850 [Candidatus Limnocylindrales bacterium]|nr:hypothetical protein [Candidatus Limnocylindrales bacterium]